MRAVWRSSFLVRRTSQRDRHNSGGTPQFVTDKCRIFTRCRTVTPVTSERDESHSLGQNETNDSREGRSSLFAFRATVRRGRVSYLPFLGWEQWLVEKTYTLAN